MWSIGVVICAALVVGMVSRYLELQQARATELYSWTNQADPIVQPQKTEYTDGATAVAGPTWGCTSKYVINVNPGFDGAQGKNCFISGRDILVNAPRSYAVRVGSFDDNKTFPLNVNNNQSFHILIPGTNKLIKHTRHNTAPGRLTITNNIRDKMTPVRDASGQLQSFDYTDSPEYIFEHANGAWDVGDIAYSNNGKWLVAEVKGVGLVRIDLTNYAAKRFSTYDANSSGSVEVRLAISDDGEHAALFGPQSGYSSFSFYDIPENCGDTLGTEYVSSSVPVAGSCASKVMPASFNASLGLYYSMPPQAVRYGNENGEIKYVTSMDSESGSVTWGRLYAPGYAPQRLGYLAMGDSYSSGEGDTDQINNTDIKWYLPATDVNENKSAGVPREKCHISLRSYPYKVNQEKTIEGGMKSIACSGAVIDDVVGNNSSYMGQPKGGKSDKDDPRLEGYVDANALKSEGLNNFIPGRNKQIEFVKQYQPKVITLTMGGNDTGFADKIEACVQLGTCDYATVAWRGKLKSEITGSYDRLVDLYTKLYEASGKSAKIYVLGYPQFINADANVSCQSIFGMNDEERSMIFNSVTYMNNVIEQAAKAAGVKYVDIENSLQGHRICDNDTKYVTAITNIFGANGNERQESFHPNSLGHAAIKDSISQALGNSSLLEYNVCPNLPSGQTLCPDYTARKDNIPSVAYFDNQVVSKSEYKPMMNTPVVKGTQYDVAIPSYKFAPGSSTTLTFHSDPVEAGSYTASSTGGLDVSISIPSELPAGFHTLVLNGTSYDGQPITISQVIEVRGSNQSDIDEDGIADNLDSCAYIPLLNSDADLDGIDDACDPEVGSSPLIYRARTGDTNRQYGSGFEKSDYIYLERNTRAASITGITGDYDPDGDGWSIVSASQGTPYTTTSRPDAGPVANFIVEGTGVSTKPYVYLRAGGYGCVSYRASSLSKVEAGQTRYLTRVADNTDKCRKESPSDDLDNNGLADNVQPIYTARNGIQANGEDPSRIYLYRSFHAAEAQLGISDYTPWGTAAGNYKDPIREWNLLASSQGEYIPAYNKLVILEGSVSGPLPTILTKKLNGECIAYQPKSTEIIKMTTQATRTFNKLTSLPAGVNCD